MTNINWVQRTTQISIILIGLVFAFSCSKRKLVYYSPNLVKPVIVNGDDEQDKASVDSLLTVQHNYNKLKFTSHSVPKGITSNFLYTKSGKSQVVNQANNAVVKVKVKQSKVAEPGFLMTHVGLVALVLLGLLAVILSSSSLDGDLGCLLFFSLLLLGGYLLVSILIGLARGAFNL